MVSGVALTLLDDVTAAAALVQERLGSFQPHLAIVAGSGLAAGFSGLHEQVRMELSDLPGFPQVTVTGQHSFLSAGTLFGLDVLVFFGRYHVYEGYSAWQVTAQVRLAAALGCRKLLLTNAAGGIAPDMRPGDFMLVADHLNLTGHNPLIGQSQRSFIDLGRLYYQPDDDLITTLARRHVRLHRGVLAWMLGPSYETPAEIDFLEKVGASAVSMSTIPEAIVGRLCGLDLCAVSLIANQAAGRGSGTLHHDDVLAAGHAQAAGVEMLLSELLPYWHSKYGGNVIL